MEACFGQRETPVRDRKKDNNKEGQNSDQPSETIGNLQERKETFCNACVFTDC